MGRKKIQIERIESKGIKKVTYSKRRSGLFKKAKELSILCDTDLLLLTFSPSGKPDIFLGERNSKIEDVFEKFFSLTPEEREKGRIDSFNNLKNGYKESDHEVDSEVLLDERDETVEDLEIKLKSIQDQVTATQQMLGPLRFLHELENLNSIEEICEMEQLVNQAIAENLTFKENFLKQLSENQNQNGEKTEFELNDDMTYPSPHLSTTDNEQILLPQGDMDAFNNLNTLVDIPILINQEEASNAGSALISISDFDSSSNFDFGFGLPSTPGGFDDETDYDFLMF